MGKSKPSTSPAGAKGEGEGGGEAQPAFQDAIAEVEAITDRIEGGEIGLEDSIDQFERGMKLLGRCREILQRAEQRVVDITQRLRDPEAQPTGEARDTDERGAAH